MPKDHQEDEGFDDADFAPDIGLEHVVAFYAHTVVRQAAAEVLRFARGNAGHACLRNAYYERAGGLLAARGHGRVAFSPVSQRDVFTISRVIPAPSEAAR